jgi:diamine N-acetyltransferase
MIELRSPEPEDLEFLYGIENDTENWAVSNTRSTYSKQQLLDLILSSHNPFEAGQCRFIITCNKEIIGTIDLFDFDPFHGNGAVGIFIKEDFRQKGNAFEALKRFLYLCKKSFGMNSVLAQIDIENHASLKLFIKAGFEKVGELKSWRRVVGEERKSNGLFQIVL